MINYKEKILSLLKNYPEGITSVQVNDIFDEHYPDRKRNLVNQQLNVLLKEGEIFAISGGVYYIYYHSNFKHLFDDSQRIDKPRPQTSFAKIAEELSDVLTSVLVGTATKPDIIRVLNKYTEMTDF